MACSCVLQHASRQSSHADSYSTNAVQIPNVVAAAASILLQLQPGVKAFEKTFRQEFGNNPDTSKALRL